MRQGTQIVALYAQGVGEIAVRVAGARDRLTEARAALASAEERARVSVLDIAADGDGEERLRSMRAVQACELDLDGANVVLTRLVAERELLDYTTAQQLQAASVELVQATTTSASGTASSGIYQTAGYTTGSNNDPLPRTSDTALGLAYDELNEWLNSEDGQHLLKVGALAGAALNAALRNALKLTKNPLNLQALAGVLLMGYFGKADNGDAVEAGMMLYENFQTGGEWDAKPYLAEAMDIESNKDKWLSMPNGDSVYYDVFGNIQYGYMMSRFSVDQDVALDASHAEGAAGNPDQDDDPAIILGYELAELYPDGMTEKQFSEWFYSSDIQERLREAGKIE